MFNQTTIGYYENEVSIGTVYHGYPSSTELAENYYTGYLDSNILSNNSQTNMTTNGLPASIEAVIGLSLIFCIIG